MISVLQAKKLVLQHCTRKNIGIINLEDAVGNVVAEDIYSNYDIPPFDQSAMDGYAFRLDDLTHKDFLDIAGEIPAGTETKDLQGVNNTMRIFTGAPVPRNADVVVMQEKVAIMDQKIFIKDDQLTKGSNIRTKGSQTKKGELAMKMGTKLNAASSGFLAGLGIAELKVYKAPKISL